MINVEIVKFDYKKPLEIVKKRYLTYFQRLPPFREFRGVNKIIIGTISGLIELIVMFRISQANNLPLICKFKKIESSGNLIHYCSLEDFSRLHNIILDLNLRDFLEFREAKEEYVSYIVWKGNLIRVKKLNSIIPYFAGRGESDGEVVIVDEKIHLFVTTSLSIRIWSEEFRQLKRFGEGIVIVYPID